MATVAELKADPRTDSGGTVDDVSDEHGEYQWIQIQFAIAADDFAAAQADPDAAASLIEWLSGAVS